MVWRGSNSDEESGKERKRRPHAEATVERIILEQRPIVRRTTAAVLILRLAPVVVPIALRFTLDPILSREKQVLFGLVLSPTALLALVVSVGFGVALVRALANYTYLSLAGQSGHALVADLRVAMFEHVLRIPVSYADRRGTGKILLRFIGDSDALRTWVSRTSPAVTADRIVFVVLIAVMILINWQLAIVTLAPLPLLVFAIGRLTPRLRELTRHARRLQSEFTGHVEARFDSLRQAKWLDRDRQNRRLTREIASGIAWQNAQRDRHAAFIDSLGQFLAFLSVPLLIAVGVCFAWRDSLTLGEYVAFVWLAAHLSVTLQRLNSAVVVQQKANVSLERILRLLERSAERGRSSHLPQFAAAGRSIHAKDLVFCENGPGSAEECLNIELHGPGVQVLDERIDAAAFYEVVLGFRRAKNGCIYLDDQQLDKVSILSIRHAVSWIPPNPTVFEGTVLDNICFAAPRLGEREIVQMAASFLPEDDKLDSWLNKDAGPNGQKLTRDDALRLGVLRALVSSPKFILIDNLPCSDQTVTDLQRLVTRLGNQALICVTYHVGTQLDSTAAFMYSPARPTTHPTASKTVRPFTVPPIHHRTGHP